MSTTEKVVLFIVFILLVVGIAAPFQYVTNPIYFGFLPAPIFYLIIVHVLFALMIGYMAFFTRLHGRVENEEAFLAEARAAKEAAR